MRPALVLGVLLIALGIAALVFRGIPYTSEKTVVDLGPIHATERTQKRVALPPLLGGAALAAGVVIVIASRASRRDSTP